MISRSILPLAILALAGCAATVSVRHYVAPERLGPAQAGRAARVYLFLQVPPADDAGKSGLAKALDVLGAFSSKDNRSLSRPMSRLELDELARRTARAFRGPASRIVAYQVVYGSAPPAWLEDFSPSGSLWLQPSDVSVDQEELKEKIKTRDGEKEQSKYRLTLRHRVSWRFYAEPEHTLLAEASYAEPRTEELEKKAGDLEAYLKPRLDDEAARFLDPLRSDLLPHELTRERTLWGGGSDVSAGVKLAKGGDWDGAVRVWKDRAAAHPEEAEAHFDLGVAYELAGRYDDSRREYGAARARSEGGRRRELDRIAQELGRLMAPPPAAASASGAAPSPFYLARLAVLPFANDSVDLSAHDYLRLKVSEALTRRGYNLAPATDVDGKLRELGVREGGQLGLRTPKELAAALGADRLLYGTVEEFKTVNAGVYFKRQVRLRLRMTDADGRTVWDKTAQTIAQSGVRPKAAAAALASGLAATAVEKASRTYLHEEADETVRRGLETLPQPPPDVP